MRIASSDWRRFPAGFGFPGDEPATWQRLALIVPRV